MKNDTIEVNATTILAIRSPVPVDMLRDVARAITKNLESQLEASMRQQGDWFLIETALIDKPQ